MAAKKELSLQLFDDYHMMQFLQNHRFVYFGTPLGLALLAVDK
jgi:hypothetical protein